MLLFVIYLWLLWWAVAFFPVKWVSVKKLPAIAMTIAPFIFYNPDRYFLYNKERLIKHEMRHIQQQRMLSPAIMLILYLAFSIILFVFYLAKYHSLKYAFMKCYRENPFEVDARKYERPI